MLEQIIIYVITTVVGAVLGFIATKLKKIKIKI